MSDTPNAARDALTRSLDTLEAAVLGRIAGGDGADADALLFLLRLYQLTGRADLADVLGNGLAAALRDHQHETTLRDRSDYLALFVEASALSGDERLAGAIGGLVAMLEPACASAAIDEAIHAIGACLVAASLDQHRDIAPAAIDQLERVVGSTYRPGVAVGAFETQVHTAAALLTAYAISGRLPYSMLAEELMQTVRRSDASSPAGFRASCEAARVLCRLAALHGDPEYRRAAVFADDADYRGDAAAMLNAHADEARRLGSAGAIYGVAVLELESGRSGDSEFRTPTS
ncbi:MAG TPA: hypothetical protein VH583_10755 [Vicinamibacterales bacterium]